jgi:hypothetical protein
MGEGWCLSLQLQKLLLNAGDRLHPLLNLGMLCLKGVLKVYNPVGIDVHLLMCKVQLLTGVVPPVLGLTKIMICDPQLAVLI